MGEFKYRPDVDGLRAVAVVLVLLFHADLGCPGGFVGVDVFFVISGFLITGLILKQQAEGTFHLRSFWVRRIRRILPAALVMTLGTLAIGAVVLVPEDYRELGESSVAQQLMISNVFFWKKASYFGGSANLKPLLHTWSLAVEEQFYLGYPLLLVLLSRRRRRTTGWILAAITIASFAVSQWGVHASPRATFFLLPTRAWEMLLGGLLWFAPLTSRLTERRAELASWISLTGILGAAWLFDSNTLFPGLAACLPCGATALLIYANSVHTTRVAKLLSLGPLVFVGLISYSLYLWHWPLFVFSRYGMTEPLSMAHRFGLLVLSGIVGYLSWRFVETPWRRGFRFRSERPAMVMAAGAVAFVVIAGLGVRNHDGLPSRFDVRTRHLLATMQNGQFRQSVPMDAIQRGSLPEFGAEGRPIGLLVWGDSHAMAMIPAIDHVCRQRGICGVQATYASTLPLAGFSTGRKWEASPNYAGHVLRFAIDNRIPLVVLAGYWSRDASHPDFALSLQHTVDCLSKAGCRVIVVRDIPEQQPGLKQTLIAALSRDQRMDTLGVDLSQHRQRQAAADLALLAVQSERVSVVDPTPFLLDEHERCRIVVNGESLYRNQDHLSRVGAIRLAPMFDPRIRQLAAMPGRRRF